MRNRLLPLVLLASALTFLASLYLPWRVAEPRGSTFAFSISGNDGWSTEPGVMASLAALALAAIAAKAVVRHTGALQRRFTPFALAMLYLAIGGVLVIRAQEKIFARNLHFHYGYGMFLGLAATAAALLGAVGLEGTTLRRLQATEGLAALLGIGLLASCLLTWASPFGPAQKLEFPGVTLGLVVLLTAGVCLLAGSPLRLSAALVVAVLTGAGVNAIWLDTIRYGAWLALGFAIALTAVAALTRPEPRPSRPQLATALGAAAATVLVVSLFLPWQQFCSPGGNSFGDGIGTCIGTTGWAAGDSGAVAGVLALLLIVGALAASRLGFPPTEIVLGIATLVAVIGASIGESVGYPDSSFGYGAYVGFAATGILLFIAVSRVPPPRIEDGPALVRLVPLAVALATFLAVALPAWSALPPRWSVQAVVLKSWYSVAGLLLTIHLLRRWLESARRIPFPSDQLVVLPLALLALTALELVRDRANGMTWGGGILVALCLLLALLGWMEPRGQLESFRVPDELWRIDRLPGES